VLTGPYFALIEKALYARPEFIKHVPVRDRPRYIQEMLGSEGGRYIETDHSSFEAHISAEMMKCCEMQLYHYMLRDVKGGSVVLHHIRNAIAGENVCKSRFGTVRVQGTRMSGDMCTSLGNGFTNLMAMKFMANELGAHVTGVVEGDDGLFRVDGQVPSVEDFASIGFTLKAAVRERLNESSFCGLVFADGEEENITDPRPVLCKFGWTMSAQRFGGPRILSGLLRAKALSLAYELPGCPVVRNLALAALRATEGVKPIYSDGRRAMSYWQEQVLGHPVMDLSDEIVARIQAPVSIAARHLVSERYGIDIAQQLRMESYLNSISEVRPLSHPDIFLCMKGEWVDHWRFTYGIGLRGHHE
jgi:hypothetical protein